MLDALERTVNKTPLGDTRSSARHVGEESVAEDENAPGQMSREVDRIGNDERRVAALALLRQPSTQPRQLERGEIGEVEQVQRRLRRLSAPPEVVATQVMAGGPGARLARFVPEPAHDALVRRKQAGDAQQQRRSPRTRRTNDCRDLPALDLQVDAAQNRIGGETRPDTGREPFMKTDHLERERHALR